MPRRKKDWVGYYPKRRANARCKQSRSGPKVSAEKPIVRTFPELEPLSLLCAAAERVERDDASFEALYGPRDRSPSPSPSCVIAADSGVQLAPGVRPPTPTPAPPWQTATTEPANYTPAP
jgi:hypothetical protein